MVKEFEDYVFKNNGDLDEYNGRFEINEDYPNGVYAYHATGDKSTGIFIPTFPYFIGGKYRSKVENDNFNINAFNVTGIDELNNKKIVPVNENKIE